MACSSPASIGRAPQAFEVCPASGHSGWGGLNFAAAEHGRGRTPALGGPGGQGPLAPKGPAAPAFPQRGMLRATAAWPVVRRSSWGAAPPSPSPGHHQVSPRFCALARSGFRSRRASESAVLRRPGLAASPVSAAPFKFAFRGASTGEPAHCGMPL